MADQDVTQPLPAAVLGPSGRTEHPTLAAARAARGDGFVWLDLAAPTAAELTAATAPLKLPPLAVEDAVTSQRPKIEQYDDLLVVVLRPAAYLDDDERVDVAQVTVLVTPDTVVTVGHGCTTVLDRIRAELAAPDPGLLAFGPVAVLYRVADLVVDDYESVITALDADLERVEDAVFAPDEVDHSQRIYRLKDEVAVFRRAVDPLVRPVEQLYRGSLALVAEDTAHHFRDVHDHLLRAAESADLLDHQLSDALEANSASVTMAQNRIALRQNEDMRKISAWAAMALVPTLIAGIYGMNLQLWPNDGHGWGFPTVLTSMVVVCVVLYRAFRRNGWL